MAAAVAALAGSARAEPLVDAALYTNDRTYLFQGGSYFRLKDNKVEAGYPKFLDEWKGMPNRFLGGIDAALHFPDNGKTYIFKGSEYVRIDGITVEKNYPAPIARNWKGLPPRFHRDLDAALYHGGHVYFFKGNEYVRFTGTTMDTEYPRQLPGGWDLPKGYRNGLTAALDRPGDKNYFFVDGGYVRLSGTRLDENYPARMSNWQGVVKLARLGRKGSGLLSSEVYRLRLQVVTLIDDDGYFGTDMRSSDFARLIANTNELYMGTGIQFDFDPNADWQQVVDTYANADADGDILAMRKIGNDLAATYPGKMLVILRYGGKKQEQIPTGNGNAYPPPNDDFRPRQIGNDSEQNYVALPNHLQILLDNDNRMAHEFGHYLGLYHTFPGFTDTCNIIFGNLACTGGTPTPEGLATAILDFAANPLTGTGIDSFDGDALADTPPDPGPFPYNLIGQNFCVQPKLTITGRDFNGNPGSLTFEPSNRNIMSYYGKCAQGMPDRPLAERFTTEQIRRMRWTLANAPTRKHLID